VTYRSVEERGPVLLCGAHLTTPFSFHRLSVPLCRLHAARGLVINSPSLESSELLAQQAEDLLCGKFGPQTDRRGQDDVAMREVFKDRSASMTFIPELPG
jgi:hypothetical protein